MNYETFVSPTVRRVAELIETCAREIGVGMPEGRAIVIARTIELIELEFAGMRHWERVT